MIKNILKNDFVKLCPDETVNSALIKMKQANKKVAVVVDNEDNLMGIIVKTDVYRFLEQQGHFGTYPVELAMTKDVITASCEDNIIDVAKVLRNNDISAVPIISDKKVIGLVTLEDIVDYFIGVNS